MPAMVRRLLWSLAILLAGLRVPAVAAHAAWPQTPPNDTQFAPCENAATFTSDCYSDPGADQWDMFGVLSDTQYPCPPPILQHPDGGLPCWATAAFDPDHMSGVNFTGAWAQGNVGRDDILIAYMEGGVNYSSNSIKDALDNEWLNKGGAALSGARRRDQPRLARLLRPRRQRPLRHPGLGARPARQPVLPRGRSVRYPGRPRGRTGHRRGGHQPQLRQQRPASIPERRQRPGNADALPFPRRPHRRLRPLPDPKGSGRAVSGWGPFRQRRQRLSQRHQRLEQRPQQQ